MYIEDEFVDTCEKLISVWFLPRVVKYSVIFIFFPSAITSRSVFADFLIHFQRSMQSALFRSEKSESGAPRTQPKIVVPSPMNYQVFNLIDTQLLGDSRLLSQRNVRFAFTVRSLRFNSNRDPWRFGNLKSVAWLRHTECAVRFALHRRTEKRNVGGDTFAAKQRAEPRPKKEFYVSTWNRASMGKTRAKRFHV